jgi:hypothetical protein
MEIESEDLYTLVWMSIRNRCTTLGLTFQPVCVNFDFELAAINAMRQVFPSVPVFTCRFHYGQALWRNIQRFGLTDDYKSKSETGDWLHLFNGLPFLPPDEVPDAFSFDIMSTLPNNLGAHKFADYFCDTYY